jgi:hypothetical protein
MPRTANKTVNSSVDEFINDEFDELDAQETEENPYADLIADIKRADIRVRRNQKLLTKAMASDDFNPDTFAQMTETHRKLLQQLTLAKRALKDAKKSTKKSDKIMCAWCGQKPATNTGFCSMKHAAAYGAREYRETVINNPDRFSTETKTLLGIEIPA